MINIRVKVLVSQFRNEKRTFQDRETGKSREYTFCQLAGITTNLTTPVLLRVPETIAKVPALVDWVRPGCLAAVQLGQCDASKGILEGSVLNLAPLSPEVEEVSYRPEEDA